MVASRLFLSSWPWKLENWPLATLSSPRRLYISPSFCPLWHLVFFPPLTSLVVANFLRGGGGGLGIPLSPNFCGVPAKNCVSPFFRHTPALSLPPQGLEVGDRMIQAVWEAFGLPQQTELQKIAPIFDAVRSPLSTLVPAPPNVVGPSPSLWPLRLFA